MAGFTHRLGLGGLGQGKQGNFRHTYRSGFKKFGDPFKMGTVPPHARPQGLDIIARRFRGLGAGCNERGAPSPSEYAK